MADDTRKPEYIMVPIEPPPGLIDSMCMRWRHDFGMVLPDDYRSTWGVTSGMTEAERNSLRADMRKVYEEVVGTGFWTWRRDNA